MSEGIEKSKIGQLLEKLQEESWQLELLISGFAIFLIAGSWESLRDHFIHVEVLMVGSPEGMPFAMISSLILLACWFFLLINLILHVFLRGFWISAIGLRYISGDVDFEALNFSSKFDTYLRKQIPSFDRYIERLEKICSVVFAFTFIIIFMFLSLGLFVAFLVLVDRLILDSLETLMDKSIHDIITAVSLSIIGLSGFIYFIDFLSLGWVKRKAKFSKFYFPIYRFWSWITLSFLYRPLYYNLIDDKFGRRVGFLLLPYIILVVSIVTMRSESFLYFPTKDGIQKIDNDHYQDLLGEDHRIDEASIPAKQISDDYLELFIPYVGLDDKAIEFICPELRPDKTTGTKLTIVQFQKSANEYSPIDSMMNCVSQVHEVYVDDSLYQDLSYHFYIHPNKNEHGLLTMIDLEPLQRGEHTILVNKRRVTSTDSLHWVEYSKFPFWKND